MVKDFYADLLKVQITKTGEAYIPSTIAFVFRKRRQYLELMKLPKEKRPSEFLFWVAPSEELEKFLDDVLENNTQSSSIIIDESEIM